MATSNDLRSKRLSATHAFLTSYSKLSPEALLENFSPNFTHQVLPSSLNIPKRDRQAFAQHATGFTKLFKSFNMVPERVFEDPSSNTVIVYAKMIGELHAIGPWENECVLIIEMSEEGEKIERLREFVDSARANLLREKMSAHMNAKRAEELMRGGSSPNDFQNALTFRIGVPALTVLSFIALSVLLKRSLS
jgi:ketosteroid isomerase-like protein